MHADQTAGVATIGTGFRAEARRMGGHFDRQVVFVDDFIAYQVGQRHFRRRDQRVVAAVSFFFQRTCADGAEYFSTGTLNTLQAKEGYSLQYFYYLLKVFNFEPYKTGKAIR